MIVPLGNWSITPAEAGATLVTLVQLAALPRTGQNKNKTASNPTQNSIGFLVLLAPGTVFLALHLDVVRFGLEHSFMVVGVYPTCAA
jgi:hypothetical protein